MNTLTLPLAKIATEIGQGKSVYLYGEIPHSEGSKAVTVKTGACITSGVLRLLREQKGDDFTLEIGYEPMKEVALTATSTIKTGIVKRIQSQVKDELRRPKGGVFTNKSLLITLCKESESLLTDPACSKPEELVQAHGATLNGTREPGTFLSMGSRALADAFATLYLDLQHPKRPPRNETKEEAHQTSIILGALLKDVGRAAEIELDPRIDREAQHPGISVQVLRGKTKLSPEDLSEKALVVDRTDPLIASIQRILLGHEETMTKSAITQCVVRGRILTDWILALQEPDVPIVKDDFRLLGYIDTPCFASALDLLRLSKNPKVRQILALMAKENIPMKAKLFLAKAGGPFETAEDFETAFTTFFSTYPDYHPLKYALLKNGAHLLNQLRLAGKNAKDAGAALGHYSDQVKTLFLS